MKTLVQRLALLAALACMPFAPAYAQATDPPKDPAKAEEPKEGETQRVIVTSNRRNEEQQKVSGVVQSVSGDQLRKDGVQELRNLQTVIPGLSISTQEGAVDIYIRGVGTGNNTELGDPGAAPHINGVYLPRPRGLGLMFYDLERVEVNKGPQGTLYGRNALAGTLNIITAKPKLGQTSGYLQADVSDRSGRGAEGAFNLPLGETMAARAAFQYVKRDMGYQNVSGPRATTPAADIPFAEAAGKLKPAGLEDNFGARLSYRWDINDKMRLQVMADGGQEKGTGYPGSNVRPAATATGKGADDLDLRKIHYRGPQGELKSKLWGLQSKLDYDFGPFGAELTGSARDVNFRQTNASSAGVDFEGFAPNYDDFQRVYWQAKSRATIGELRFYNSDSNDQLNWNAGLFGFREKQATAFMTTSDRGYCCYSGTEFTMPNTTVKSAALYADGTFKLDPENRVLGGLRYSKESKYRYGIGGNWGLALGGFRPDDPTTPANENYSCCFGTRYGTEGFVPSLLNRGNFDLSQFYDASGKRIDFNNNPTNDPKLNQLKRNAAQLFLNSFLTPGARDTGTAQIGPVANGSNGAGNCFSRPDISNGGLPCPDPSFNGNNGGFTFVSVTVPEQQLGYTKASYGDFRLGFEHDLNKDQMLYAKVSTGHKGGGFNDSNQGVAKTYKPEKLTVLEVGSRNAFPFNGRRAVANATAFYYDYKDYVLQSLTCSGYLTDPVTGAQICTGSALNNENAAGAKIKGLELEFRAPLWAGANVDLNAALLDAKITRGVVVDARSIDFSNGLRASTIELAGNRMPLASKVYLTARYQQKIPFGAGAFDWQLIASYRSQYYLDQFNDRDITYINGTVKTPVQAGLSGSQKGYTQFNLGAGYEFGNGLRLEGWITNLTDVQASQKRLVGQDFDLRFLNDARTYGLRVRGTF
jgi:iron complex outermembrane recepter protein